MLKTTKDLMNFSIPELNRDLPPQKVFYHNKLMLRIYNTIKKMFIQVNCLYNDNLDSARKLL